MFVNSSWCVSRASGLVTFCVLPRYWSILFWQCLLVLMLECTTTRLQSTGAFQLSEEAALRVSGFGQAPFWSAVEGYVRNWSTWLSSYDILHLPRVCSVGHFSDVLKRISSSSGICLLVFEAFFVQVDVLSLLMWKKTLLQQSGYI